MMGTKNQLSLGTSWKVLASESASGLSFADHRKVAASARVQLEPTPNVLSEMPFVISFSRAHITGRKNQSFSCTSTKGDSLQAGEGLPFAAHRKVTISSRVHSLFGANW